MLNLYNVLVVDDENMIRISFEKLINWRKYNLKLTAIACNGEEALNIILNNKIDILITDIKMPVMDGISLLRELKLRNIAPLAIIVLSAFNEYQLIRDSFKLNVDDYILKSDYDEDSVIEIVLKVLEKKSISLSNKDIIIPSSNNPNHSIEINKTLEYLHKNFHKNLSLSDISSNIGYSDSYLSHLFSTEMGLTIIEYLNKIRIEYSKELLNSTNYKIYEISSKVGFQNSEHFSRCFKKLEGISPKQYKYTIYK